MKFPNPFRALAAAYRAVKARFSGKDVFVTQDESDRRWKICNACPEQDLDWKQCKVCTCFLTVKNELATERCPLGKW